VDSQTLPTVLLGFPKFHLSKFALLLVVFGSLKFVADDVSDVAYVQLIFLYLRILPMHTCVFGLF